jgi:hypothetical protein
VIKESTCTVAAVGFFVYLLNFPLLDFLTLEDIVPGSYVTLSCHTVAVDTTGTTHIRIIVPYYADRTNCNVPINSFTISLRYLPNCTA